MLRLIRFLALDTSGDPKRRQTQAADLLAYLRSSGLHVRAASRELQVRGGLLGPETQERVIALKPHLLDLLKAEASAQLVGR